MEKKMSDPPMETEECLEINSMLVYTFMEANDDQRLDFCQIADLIEFMREELVS